MSIELNSATVFLREERMRLRQEHLGGADGYETARRLAESVDKALLTMLPSDRPRQAWALVAMGGYGRRELSPCSDIDIMVLCQKHDQSIEKLANSLFYGLWDAGQQVGHGVRTVDESLRLAESSLETQTALVDARLISGNSDLFDQLRRRLDKDLTGKRSTTFLRSLWQEYRRRHQEMEESGSRLEPNLKEGKGGLRDYHTIIWGAAALGAKPLAELVSRGLFTEEELVAVGFAVSFIHRLRHHIHYVSYRHADQLLYALQEEAAQFLGYTDGSGRLAVESLMRDVHRHMDRIWQAASGFWEAMPKSVTGNYGDRRSPGVAPSVLVSQLPAPLPLETRVALNLFGEAARLGRIPEHSLVRHLRTGLTGAAPIEDWNPQEREDFFAVLRAPEVGLTLLEAMSRCGLLTLCIPAWATIEFLALQEIYHVNTVDRHCFRAVVEVSRLASESVDDIDPLARQIYDELTNPDLLLLAALIHDLGKGSGQDHSEEGALQALELGKRMGLRASEIDDLVFLVQEHLLLARMAMRRDIDDEELVLRLAKRIGTPERLKMLYLLTMADSRATGPGAWNEWKATLVRELFGNVMRVLESGRLTHRDARTRVAEKQEAVRTALAGTTDKDEIEAFMARMPLAYFRSQPANTIARHYAFLSRPSEGPVRIQTRRLHRAHRYEVLVSVEDRPGLLWRICGVFALHGLNIFEARVYTGDVGVALDVFQVANAFEPDIGSEKLAAIERDIALAVVGRLALGYRLAEKLRHYPALPNGGPVIRPRVLVDNSASEEYTVVDVHAPDRLGLLYTITRTLSDMHLDIHLAKVATRGHEAIDAFYVRDLHGHKVTDHEHISEIEKTVLFELGRDF